MFSGNISDCARPKSRNSFATTVACVVMPSRVFPHYTVASLGAGVEPALQRNILGGDMSNLSRAATTKDTNVPFVAVFVLSVPLCIDYRLRAERPCIKDGREA